MKHVQHYTRPPPPNTQSPLWLVIYDHISRLNLQPFGLTALLGRLTPKKYTL